jgi:hypothetical protein
MATLTRCRRDPDADQETSLLFSIASRVAFTADARCAP